VGSTRAGGLTNSSWLSSHIKLIFTLKVLEKMKNSTNKITIVSAHQEAFCSNISAEKEQKRGCHTIKTSL